MAHGPHVCFLLFFFQFSWIGVGYIALVSDKAHRPLNYTNITKAWKRLMLILNASFYFFSDTICYGNFYEM